MLQPTPDSTSNRHDSPTGIAYLIGRLNHVLKRRIGDCVMPYGITGGQYTALAVLHRHGQLSNAQLAVRFMVSPQSANEMVKTMESKGWVEREPASAHGRIIHLRLTEAGRILLETCDRAVAALELSMLAALPGDQHAALQKQLRSMLQAVNVPDA